MHKNSGPIDKNMVVVTANLPNDTACIKWCGEKRKRNCQLLKWTWTRSFTGLKAMTLGKILL
ncbi:hypothetical protein CQ062_18145 [Ochrobactrum sp. MYb68]|nr:hypothetical protein CQ062_18145 [Ochrobactrum sp. MYb68]